MTGGNQAPFGNAPERRPWWLWPMLLIAPAFAKFEPNPILPRRAALLSALFPGLGLWYIGQSGIFTFYLSWVLVSIVGAADLLRRYAPGSAYRAHFLTWGLLAVAVGLGFWLLSVVDSYLRGRRIATKPLPPQPANRNLAAVLSLLLPGLGQIYSRRFLIGIWTFLLIIGLGITAHEIYPWHPQAYYAQFDTALAVPENWLAARDLGLRTASFTLLLWLLNVVDAFWRAGQYDVLPEALTRHITFGRMANAWPDFLLALGFLAIEWQALDSWWPEPLLLINYLRYWFGYECLGTISVLFALRVAKHRQIQSEARRVLTVLILTAAAAGLLLVINEKLSGAWLLATFGVMTAPRLLQLAVVPVEPEDVLSRQRQALACLFVSGLLLVPVFIFWKMINPDFYRHLQQTYASYTLGMLFFFLMGCLELRNRRNFAGNQT